MKLQLHWLKLRQYPKCQNRLLFQLLLHLYLNEKYGGAAPHTISAEDMAKIEAVKYFYHDFPNDLIDYALTNIFWPGRLEFIDKNIIIDGAHNISAIKELINTLKALKFKKIKIIFYALKDKNYKDMLNELNKICSKFYFTNILDTRSSNIEDFINYITSDYEIIDDYIECYKKAKNELLDDELLLITGSLHFISMMRKLKDL